MTDKSLKSMNNLISDPNYHCDTFLLNQYYHMKKIIDFIGLNESYLFCICMNINKNVENRGKQGENYSNCKVLKGFSFLH